MMAAASRTSKPTRRAQCATTQIASESQETSHALSVAVGKCGEFHRLAALGAGHSRTAEMYSAPMPVVTYRDVGSVLYFTDIFLYRANMEKP